MSTANTAPAETLLVRKTPWRKRLWVRLLLLVVPTLLIVLAVWWWPRRGMIAVWRAGGTLTSADEIERTRLTLRWWDPSGGGWSWRHFQDIHRLLSAFRVDNEITHVQLDAAQVEDRWLSHLQTFQKMKVLVLHDRQLGPGLKSLQGNSELPYLAILHASSGHLAELQWLPQLEDVAIWRPDEVNIGVESLSALPNLKYFSFHETSQTGQLLAKLPELPNLETFSLELCTGFADSDLVHLQRLSNLKTLSLFKTGPIGDAELIEIAKLQSLETLHLRLSLGNITDDGLQALTRLPNLKEFIVVRGDLTPSQLDLLKQLLPNAVLREY